MFDNKNKQPSQTSYNHRVFSSLRVILTEATPLLLVITIPLSVHAGLFSTLLGMVQESDVSPIEQTAPASIGDIRLLSSRTNSDPIAALGGGDIAYEDGALIPNAPFGPDDYAEIKNSNGEISIYTVREGDSLSQVAEMFGVTTNTILWANDLAKATAIRPGDDLIILPIVGVRHIVKSGDTLSSIAKKYESEADEILSYNQIASAADLTTGQTLIIPGGNLHEAAPKKVAASSGSAKKSASASGSGGGGFINPLPGSLRTQGIHGYNGVDLAAPVGTPIRAAAAGEVIVSKSSGYNGGYGNYVVVKHSNGSQTLYAHMSSNAVAVGSRVTAGDTVGYVGNTGRSTGAHLHFEVRGASNPF